MVEVKKKRPLGWMIYVAINILDKTVVFEACSVKDDTVSGKVSKMLFVASAAYLRSRPLQTVGSNSHKVVKRFLKCLHHFCYLGLFYTE